jgi:hypothetical protein
MSAGCLARLGPLTSPLNVGPERDHSAANVCVTRIPTGLIRTHRSFVGRENSAAEDLHRCAARPLGGNPTSVFGLDLLSPLPSVAGAQKVLLHPMEAS